MDAQKRPLSKTYSKAKMLSHSVSLSRARAAGSRHLWVVDAGEIGNCVKQISP